MARAASSTLLAAALLAAAAHPALAADKIRIDKADDLPRHTYTIDRPAVELLHDEAAIGALAAEVRRDLESDLATYEIPDKTTLKAYYNDLRTIAFIEGRYDDAEALLAKARELEDKEASRLTMGHVTMALMAAERSGSSDLGAAFERQLAAIVDAMPYDVVQDDIKQTKASMEIVSPSLVTGRIESTLQPMLDASGGEMSKDVAIGLLSSFVTLNAIIPYRERAARVYADYLAAHAVTKPDIWQARAADLPANAAGAPVVAIWDSGVDTAIYGPLGQLWTNPNEVPDNGVDDDGNGFVDDVHGIAYTLKADKTTELLRPMGETTMDRATLQGYVKGMLDLQANLDTPEATSLKRAIGSLEPAQVRPFLEQVTAYNHLSHGTHVAGIAAAGNPNIRLLVARITFDHKMVPDPPSIAQAYREAASMVETVDYFKANGVRIVNMSWGGNVAGIESALELNNIGATPEERKALARKIFDIGWDSLYDAIASAPEILFVTSAGNADSDNAFEEYLPSSFDLPNILSVGAVDQAGDETGFTSFGKVDVYANGFQVESYVPGGDRLPFSGTSMSSPNVVNLAAKLLAVDPSLTATQLRELILAGCDDHVTGDRTVRLINPARSMELLAERM
jgi:subtilisin family serine protease